MIAKMTQAIDVVVSAITGSPSAATTRGLRGRGTERGSSVLDGSDAVRTFGLLAGGVRADRHALDDEPRVDGDVAGGRENQREVVHAARRRAALLLADLVVLRAVAAALEPLARDALRNTAAEVRTL